jgi:hypothetical protein
MTKTLPHGAARVRADLKCQSLQRSPISLTYGQYFVEFAKNPDFWQAGNIQISSRCRIGKSKGTKPTAIAAGTDRKKRATGSTRATGTKAE